MKVNEARIGNWVLVPQLDAKILIPSYPKRIKGITLFGEFDFTEPQYPNNFQVSARHCAGIPLKEDQLKKFGGKEDENGDLYIPFGSNDLRFYLLVPDGYIQLTRSFHCPIMNFEHVIYIHRFQNLFFDFTGRELEYHD